MKKVEKVSIAEISFTLDSDAYMSLKQYLDSLHDYYDKDPDGREIIADIEARIAELILEQQVYTKVVTKSLIDTIIVQLGTPEEIDDEAGEGDGFQRATGAAGSSSDASIPRRLHRSGEGKIFGGVCSGLAKFLDINVLWVRLVFLAPIILRIFVSPFDWFGFGDFLEGWFGVFFVTYVVLWIALPMARTPRQKLEARGEKITPTSIRQTMQGSVNTPAGRKAASVAAELVTVLGRVVLFFVKFVMAVIGFSLLFASIGIFAGMIAAFFNPTVFMINSHSGMEIFSAFEGMALLSPLLFLELALLCVLLPMTVIALALLSFTFSWRLGRVFYGVTLGAWGLSMVFLGVVCIGNARFFRDEVEPRIERWEEYYEGDYGWHSRPGRVKIREIRDSLHDADRLNVDPERDSMVIVVGRDGTHDDTIVLSEGRAPVIEDDSAEKIKDESEGRVRVEIRRIEE